MRRRFDHDKFPRRDGRAVRENDIEVGAVFCRRGDASHGKINERGRGGIGDGLASQLPQAVDARVNRDGRENDIVAHDRDGMRGGVCLPGEFLGRRDELKRLARCGHCGAHRLLIRALRVGGDRPWSGRYESLAKSLNTMPPMVPLFPLRSLTGNWSPNFMRVYLREKLTRGITRL